MNKQEYKVLNPIAWGGRRERGEVIELTETEASAFAPGLIALVEKQDKPAEVENTPVEEMSVAQLRAKAKELGLDSTGTKADLLERVTLALQG